MKTNENSVDRIVRVILGLVLIVVGFWVMGGTGGIILGIIGFVPLLTGIVGFCPAYTLFNFSTKK